MLDRPTPARKLGERVAYQIEQEIAARKLEADCYLGTEIKLSERFGVSRWVMREAVAIAELDGLVESRRGQAGGLYVSVPGFGLRVATLRHYFCLTGATAVQMNELRLIIERLALLRGMQRLTVEDAERLRSMGTAPLGQGGDRYSHNTNAILLELLQIADQPALTLFCLALAQASTDRALWLAVPVDEVQQLSALTLAARTEQIEALIAHDADAVIRQHRTIAQARLALRSPNIPPADIAEAMHRASLLARYYLHSDGVRVAKKPEAITRVIAQWIVDGQYDQSDGLGSQALLLKRLGVSRNVLRESLRLLERYGIVRIQRGKTGGARPIRPDPTNVALATGLYLTDHYAQDPESFHELLRELQLLAIDRISRGIREKDRDVLDFLAGFAAADKLGDPLAYYRFLATASASPAMECMMTSLIGLVGIAAHRDDAAAWRHQALSAQLVLALQMDDHALARRSTLDLWVSILASRPEFQTPTGLYATNVSAGKA